MRNLRRSGPAAGPADLDKFKLGVRAASSSILGKKRSLTADVEHAKSKTKSTSAKGSASEISSKKLRMSEQGLSVSPEGVLLPYLAPGDGKKSKWRERFAGMCKSCHEEHVRCPHYKERQLRLLFLGHNPSEVAWQTGYGYANPSNNFWKLLRETGVIPADWDCSAAELMPELLGIGFTELGCEPGNDAAAYSRETMLEWRGQMYRRLKAHVQRVRLARDGVLPDKEPLDDNDAAPAIVAFTGKRQFTQLFEPPLKKVEAGLQKVLPPDWPLKSSRVFVLPSSSGRAAMTKEQRTTPYAAMSKLMKEYAWSPESGLSRN